MAIEVRPITATLGAEISGVDMADVSGETLEQLRKACQSRLDSAQARIEKIVAGADGKPTGTEPFDADGGA